MLTKVVKVYYRGKFKPTLQWTVNGRVLREPPLRMNFEPIKDAILTKYPELKNKSFYMVHWQAKPFTLRQWGMMHYPSGDYLTFREEDKAAYQKGLKFFSFFMMQEVEKTEVIKPVAVIILIPN